MAVRTQAPKKSRQFNLVRPVFQGFFDLHQQNGQTLYSTPEHFGGSFKSSRLFGGHTAAQSFVAAKRFRPNKKPFRIDVNFFAPGTLNHDLVYQQRNDVSDFLSIDVYQNSVLIANACVRFHKDSTLIEQPIFHRLSKFPSNILEPSAYPKVLDFMDKLYMNDWLNKHGRISNNYRNSTNENHIFMIRPIDYLHFSAISDQHKPLQIWARLSPAVINLSIPDPEAVLILLSDFIIEIPIFVLYHQRQIRVSNSATLTHKCIFHELDFNPRDYLFLELDLHQANTMALIQGRIFDYKRRLLMTFVQNHYYTLHKDGILQSKL